MDKSKIFSAELRVATSKLEVMEGKYADVLGSELTVERDGVEYCCEFSGILEEFLAPFNIRETDEIIKKIESQISNTGSQELPEEFLDILDRLKKLRKRKVKKIWNFRFGSKPMKKRPK